MMYNPQLETFLCVVEAGSFSKAAEKMYITAPAVIKQINSLESSLNLQLFDRTHRGLIVTEAGKSLYKDTKYIIQYSKDSVARAQNAMKENKEVIRVGVSPMTPPQVFVELWPKIQKMYSDIKFQICITKISTFLILCDLAVCLATLYVSFSLVFALMRYLQGKVFLIRFYSPTTLSSSRAEFRLPSRLACA